MKTIWKFPVNEMPKIPEGAEFIHLGIQKDVLYLWALVDPDAPLTVRRIKVVGTGQFAGELKAEQHIGSFASGSFVWHLFEEGIK